MEQVPKQPVDLSRERRIRKGLRLHHNEGWTLHAAVDHVNITTLPSRTVQGHIKDFDELTPYVLVVLDVG